MPTETVVLTDVAGGVRLDSYKVSENAALRLAGSGDWAISKYTLHGGVSEGVDVVEINNGEFSFSVLPTRGMGLWQGSYRGIRLGWDSPVSQPVNPCYVNLAERNGLGWLSGFNELMCRCGLSWHGSPGIDAVTDNTGNRIETPLTLHGKIANLPAHYVEISISTEDQGCLSVRGVVDETMLFGPRLRLTTTVSTLAGSNKLTITDDVTNLGGRPAEMELLYHTNFGPPLLEAGTRLVAPVREIIPTDAGAVGDIENWQTYRPPTPGYVEQCFFLELLADEDGETLVLLKNATADKGISLSFNRGQLPCFTVWKNTQAQADGYVTGLEPGTSLPNLKSFERQQGRVIDLSPGETYTTQLELAVHDTQDDVAKTERRITELQGEQTAITHRKPLPDFSPPA